MDPGLSPPVHLLILYSGFKTSEQWWFSHFWRIFLYTPMQSTLESIYCIPSLCFLWVAIESCNGSQVWKCYALRIFLGPLFWSQIYWREDWSLVTWLKCGDLAHDRAPHVRIWVPSIYWNSGVESPIQIIWHVGELFYFTFYASRSNYCDYCSSH